jgi:hypothetical protein
MDHILAQRFGAPNPVLGQIGGGIGGGGGGGGQSTADFEAIIELITKTIDPDSWEDVGGPGSIAEFEGGVVVDVDGVLARTSLEQSDQPLRDLRNRAIRATNNRQARVNSALRKVSLPRLEKAIQMRMVDGLEPDQAMQMLAGLTRIEYVLLYPETGDLVIAGPAGDWKQDPEGRWVNSETGRPVLRLEDLVVVLRQITSKAEARFGCSITPTQEGLKRTREFATQSAKRPLPAGRKAREQWLDRLRQTLGRQDIDVYGIDPGTRAARVLVEADYHMKLIGIGLEKGTAGVTSYLDSIPRNAPPPLDVLRWWFTLNYKAIHATAGRDAFEIRGQGVQVLSENEMLTRMGKRVHTGKSDDLNRQFAASFTEHFGDLAAKYPVYAELQNIFDLALVAALCREHNLHEQVDWHMQLFGDPKRYVVPTGPAPRQVDTVINHRMAAEGQIIACVSGGVRVAPDKFVAANAIQTTESGPLVAEHHRGRPDASPDRWWWD